MNGKWNYTSVGPGSSKPSQLNLDCDFEVILKADGTFELYHPYGKARLVTKNMSIEEIFGHTQYLTLGFEKASELEKSNGIIGRIFMRDCMRMPMVPDTSEVVINE